MKNKRDLLEGRTKEWDENDWQGRSQRQVEHNYKVMGVALTGFFFVLISMIIYGIFT